MAKGVGNIGMMLVFILPEPLKNIHMKAKILLIGTAMAVLQTSCYMEGLIDEPYYEEPVTATNQVLQAFDLWYMDIHSTEGRGEVPFLHQAFTLTFDDGVLYANNNLVGIGKTGSGIGVDVGFYKVRGDILEVAHDLDGSWILEVYALTANSLEFYHAASDTSYFLRGYQRESFNYDRLFYENIEYFLQEYTAWEKRYTSVSGAQNDFDAEQFLQFRPLGQEHFFRSSIDAPGTSLQLLQWDYEGSYQVYDIANDASLKTITLDYDYLGDGYFELYVLNDNTIELYHPDSGTVYEFRGRGYLPILKTPEGGTGKMREKIARPQMQVVPKRKQLNS